MIIIKQINNGFAEEYYLLEDGRVLNSKTGSYLKRNKNSYKLKSIVGKTQSITLKELYLLVYNKNYCRDTIENLECEIWREIPDTQGKYFCSNRGRIKSLIGYDAIIMNPYKTKDGYLRVSLYCEDGRRDLLVHRIVAMCFLPSPPRLDYQLHHLDFDRSNCQLDNIVWLDPKEHRKLHLEKEKNNNGCT